MADGAGDIHDSVKKIRSNMLGSVEGVEERNETNIVLEQLKKLGGRVGCPSRYAREGCAETSLIAATTGRSIGGGEEREPCIRGSLRSDNAGNGP